MASAPSMIYSTGPVKVISHCSPAPLTALTMAITHTQTHTHSCCVLVPRKLIPTSETVTCGRQPRPAVPELLSGSTPPPPPERVALSVSPLLSPPPNRNKDKSLHGMNKIITDTICLSVSLCVKTSALCLLF